MWYRIFCRSDAALPPSQILEQLNQAGISATGHFKGDDLGWTSAEITSGGGSPVLMERYLTKEDNLREDLNTWAGYLETLDYSPNSPMLMEWVIQTQQMITLRKPIDHPNEPLLERLCTTLSQILAAAGDGVYQDESTGWHLHEGSLLVQEY